MKIEVGHNVNMKLEPLTTPHVNGNGLRTKISSERSQFTPTVVLSVLFLTTFFKWKISKVDVNISFSQTGSAERDVYVSPPA